MSPGIRGLPGWATKVAVAVADAGTANEGAGADAEMQMQVPIPQQHRRTGKFYAGSCGLVGDHVDRKGEGRHKPHVNGRARTPWVVPIVGHKGVFRRISEIECATIYWFSPAMMV